MPNSSSQPCSIQFRRGLQSLTQVGDLTHLGHQPDPTCLEFLDLAGSFSTTFNDENYRYILYGMHHDPALHLGADSATTEALFSRARQNAVRAREITKPQGDYLKQLQV